MVGSLARRVVAVVLVACGASARADVPAAAPARTLEIFATTDVHGHLAPHVPSGRRVELGGLARLGGYLKNARARFPGRVLYLDGGDMMQGTLASNLGEGAATIRGLNALGLDAAALGNHEFDYGPVGEAPVPRSDADDPRGALAARMKEAQFPILAANVVGHAGQRPFAPYTIKELDGVPVAIIGATTAGLATTTMRPNLIGLRIDPPAQAVLGAAREAEAAGARVFVLVMHAGGECATRLRGLGDADVDDLAGCHAGSEGFAIARELAAATRRGGPRWSAIVGGHTHQPINAVVDGIPFVQAGRNGEYLAHVSIEVAGHGATARPTGHFAVHPLVPVCAAVDRRGHCAAAGEARARPPQHYGPVRADQGVEAAIAEDLRQADAVAGRRIGVELPRGLNAAYGEESPLGNLAADAMRAATGAQIGIINGGGLRADLPAGPLVYGALYESFPFDNQVVLVEMSGAELRRTVVHNLHSRFGFLSYSGLRVTARCADGKVEVEIVLSDGRPLDARARYTVGAPDFLAHGGDDALTPPRTISPPVRSVREAVEATLRARAPVLRGDEPDVFDAAHPRVRLPGARPVRCGSLEAHEEGAASPPKE